MLSKRGFEEIEGRFHDGLGTFAELALANELIELGQLAQGKFDVSACERKMVGAIDQLPPEHASRQIFVREMQNIIKAAKHAAPLLLAKTSTESLIRVRHTAAAYADAHAGDLLLEFRGHSALPVSVKTDKSGKVAVADGQTPDIVKKWAERYFKVTPEEARTIFQGLGYDSIEGLKSHYLNVSEFVAAVLTKKLALVNCSPIDFSQARPTDLEAVKHLLRQLLVYKQGNDGSHVLIFHRSTGEVKWETLLDSVDIDTLSLERISLRPSRPRSGRRIGSEFAIKVDNKAIVTFQVKHRRGKSHGTERQNEFLDVTTRLLT